MFQDFKELLFELNAHKVKYLVVGGQAVIHYAQPRTTKDLDILIQTTPKNAAAAFQALRAFGAPLRDLTPADFSKDGSLFAMGNPPVRIDIMSGMKGPTFATAWKNRAEVVVDSDMGLTAHFISREDLIVAKLAAGRLQDLADVDALRQSAPTDDATPATAEPRRRPRES